MHEKIIFKEQILERSLPCLYIETCFYRRDILDRFGNTLLCICIQQRRRRREAIILCAQINVYLASNAMQLITIMKIKAIIITKRTRHQAIKYSLAVNGIIIKLGNFDIHHYFYHAHFSNSINFSNHCCMAYS